MITYVTGDLLKSDAQCLVNTVNCEGYMGKGIAYQFKLAFPENNIDYIKACKSGTLHIGTLHYFYEKGKIIVNFPTKDKWRAKSKMEYIDIGLDQLVLLIYKLGIKSIAIPPLGSGNGGLAWPEVKLLIEQKLKPLSSNRQLQIYIYEPSKSYASTPTVEPQLSLAALVLMQIKLHLSKFNKLRLQKTAYLMDVFGGQHYFHFIKHKYGPYDHAIAVISTKIKEFQNYYNTKSTFEAYEIAYKKLTSKNVNDKLGEFIPLIEKAANYVNRIDSDSDVECITTILFLLETNGVLSETELVAAFKSWSEDKAKRFSEADIQRGIQYLYATGVIEENLTGYHIVEC
ncbi:MAG: macro domain-containing protein [Candidatus Faecalibacterium intestinavium]|uniref:Macro domain-containing protein n=1 Tax=Candidatus Faecalibacterium intestinavium TaxID=2838580 RepID=A0A9E2NRN1_9FIRM|nr:macro domain-containing protein [Candidatus Faecalibacterium intestinavium]